VLQGGRDPGLGRGPGGAPRQQRDLEGGDILAGRTAQGALRHTFVWRDVWLRTSVGRGTVPALYSLSLFLFRSVSFFFCLMMMHIFMRCLHTLSHTRTNNLAHWCTTAKSPHIACSTHAFALPEQHGLLLAFSTHSFMLVP
jgi:hypothetical protein